MSTIRDVAKLANVSVIRASSIKSLSFCWKYALRWSKAIAQLTIQPNANAQALAVQNTDTVAWWPTDGYFFLRFLVKAVDKVANASKSDSYRYWLSSCGKERETLIPLLRKRCSSAWLTHF